METVALTALRVMAGLLFLCHGMTKLLGWPVTVYFPEPVSVFSLMGVAGLLELIGGPLIALGLGTRLVAFILSGEMAFAYFMAHQPLAPLPINNEGDAPILFCFVFLYLAARGAGRWSLDYRLGWRH